MLCLLHIGRTLVPLRMRAIEIARETGEIKVFSRKTAVPEAADTNLEISLEEVLKIDPEAEEGDIVEMEVTPRDFGRIAAQAAKQVVVQQIVRPNAD